ncbi:hypothetical protein [Sinimarinibacterium flocculans]|uniref:hypothetical protein n=1 Tax=Sinimarinibacterium flocculans TaxID=985250 RepID=UPI003511F2B1
MKNTALIRACIFFQLALSTAVNADDGWVTVAASNDGTTWQAKSGSLEFTQTKGSTPIVVVTGRVTEKSGSRITVEKWYVPVSDCVKEQGTIVTLSISGEFKYENDFVFGSGNVASGMAELICGAAKQKAIEANNKGL